MPKTVNVPFTIPDGYEPAGEHIVPPNDPDGFYVTQWGAVLQGRQIQSWAAVLPVRHIPTEPKEPEKVEPPKWLGAVRNRDNRIMWVLSFDTYGTHEFLSGIYSGNNQERWVVSSIRPANCTLAPDIMPPSPELAALFGESEVEQ